MGEANPEPHAVGTKVGKMSYEDLGTQIFVST